MVIPCSQDKPVSVPHKEPMTPKIFSEASHKRPANKQVIQIRGLFGWVQEIIKVREGIPHMGPLTKVIPLKLFLDMLPSSSEDVTRALRRCFLGGSVCVVSFSFKAKLSTLWVFFDILITSK